MDHFLLKVSINVSVWFSFSSKLVPIRDFTVFNGTSVKIYGIPECIWLGFQMQTSGNPIFFFLHPTMSMFCFLCSNCWLHFNEFTICNLYHLRYHSSWFSFSHSVAFYWPRQLLLERVLKIWLIRQKDKWVRAIRVVLSAHCWSIALNFLNVSFNIFSRLVT